MHDLLLSPGRVFCPETGLDGRASVAVAAGRIVSAGPEVRGPARRTIHLPDGLLLPGLVDLHAHPARSGSKFGIDPDLHMLPRGVTTVLSQGDAGPANWDVYREETIRRSRTRVKLALNLASDGESAAGPALGEPAAVDVDACAATVRGNRGEIWGIAVNLSEATCGTSDPHWVFDQALVAADRAECPLLVGLRRTDQWPLEDQLRRLRPGDVVTYCFRPPPCCLLDDGRVHPAALQARTRGVLFDVGHGMQSFVFDVAQRAIGEGFLPDTISTDLWSKHLGQSPVHDLPRTMSKLLAAGMTEHDAFSRVTAAPAKVLGLSGEIATLRAGACADFAVLHWRPDAAPLTDVLGQTRPGGCWEAVLTVRGGEVFQSPSFG